MVIRRSRRRSERGAVAVEFALVLPIFVLLIFGIVQYGWAFFQVQQGAFAAREAARITAVGTLTCSELYDQVNSRIIASDSPTVGISYVDNAPLGERNVGDAYQVTVSFANSFDLGLLPVPETISQDAETRIENNEDFRYEDCGILVAP